MPGRFVVNCTVAKDNPDKATVAFVLANAALASGKEALVFLSIEGVRLSQRGYADAIHEEGFQPLRDLMAGFTAEAALVKGVAVVGGPTLVEFMADGAPSLSF